MKTHKPNNPVRPIINSINAPSYKLRKFLCNLIKTRINTNSPHTCSNSKEFIEKVKNFSLEKTHLLTSIDVDNMYGSIPKQEAISALREKLVECDKFKEEEINDIVSMVSEIVNQNYFMWNGKIYTDPNGVPMGGPLSALIAEIYLQKFETGHIINDTNLHRHKIVFYCRYVDDCFMIIKGTTRQSGVILNHLNSIHRSIKFKMETEKNKSLPFLDVKVIKTNNKLEFGVYRKDTQTDLVIPIESNHPMSYKLAAFRSLVHRLVTYGLSPTEFNKEKSIIKQIAFNNGYSTDLVDNMIRKCRFKLLNQNENNGINQHKFIPFRFVNKFSEHIGNVFKKSAYMPGYKINKIFKSNRPRETQNKENQRGVYLINCNAGEKCDKMYVGHTNRTFKDRFKEHCARNQRNPTSKVAQHLKDNPQHNINFQQSLEALKICNDAKRSRVWEEYFIFKNASCCGKDSMLNVKEDFTDKITFHLYNRLEGEGQH